MSEYRTMKDLRKLLSIMKKSYETAPNEVDKLRAEQLYIMFLKDFVKITTFDFEYYKQELERLNLEQSLQDKVLSEIKDIINDRPRTKLDEVLSNTNKESIVKKISNDNTKLTEAEIKLRDDQVYSLIVKLHEDFENPNSIKINTWILNFAAFIEVYKYTIDFEKLNAYLINVFNTLDKDNKFSNEFNQLLEMINNIRNKMQNDNDESLEVEEVYQAQDSTKEEAIKKANESLLKEYNIKLDENKLVNESEEKISKEEALGMVSKNAKVKLLKTNNDENEQINKEHKKIKLAAILLNLGSKKKKNNIEEEIYTNDENEYDLMKKGLGKC